MCSKWDNQSARFCHLHIRYCKHEQHNQLQIHTFNFKRCSNHHWVFSQLGHAQFYGIERLHRLYKHEQFNQLPLLVACNGRVSLL